MVAGSTVGGGGGCEGFFFQISNTYFLGTENVPSQLTIFERVAFIGHWNVRPHANPTIITLSHYPNTIPLFPFQSHFPLLTPTVIISIPLFAHQSHFFGRIFIIPLLLFSYILEKAGIAFATRGHIYVTPGGPDGSINLKWKITAVPHAGDESWCLPVSVILVFNSGSIYSYVLSIESPNEPEGWVLPEDEPDIQVSGYGPFFTFCQCLDHVCKK